MHVVIYTDLCEVDRAAWSLLAARPPASVTASAPWLEAAFSTTHGGMEPLLLACEDEEGLQGLLPLALDGEDRAVLVGAPYNDLSDALTRPGRETEAAEAILEAVGTLVDQGIAVTLHSLDPSGVLAAADARGRALRWSPERPAPAISLDRDLEEMVSNRRRRTWGNRRRRLERSHAVEFRAAAGADALAGLPVFERLREQRRAATGRPPERPPVALVAEAVRRLVEVGSAVIFEMLIDGDAVASDLYLLDPPVALMWLRGLDPAWRQFPCGHLLLCWTAARLRREGYEVLDMGRGDEAYKFVFGASDRVLLMAEATVGP